MIFMMMMMMMMISSSKSSISSSFSLIPDLVSLSLLIKVIMTLSPELEVMQKMMKKSRFAIDDAGAQNYMFKGWLGLT
jgi:ascorbate-specific PTS system EIIC-type component UlaA